MNKGDLVYYNPNPNNIFQHYHKYIGTVAEVTYILSDVTVELKFTDGRTAYCSVNGLELIYTI